MRRFWFAAAIGMTSLFFTAGPAPAATQQLTLVGYGVAKPVYAKIIPAFKKLWKQQSGNDVSFKESYGGSGAQTRAILSGLDADILVTNVQQYVDPLVEKGLVKADWSKRVPNDGSPVTSVIVMVVRKGNPKGLKTWADLTKPGIEIVALNPKTSGNARWGLLAGYGPLARAGDQQAADDYIKGIVRNTKTLSNNGREATDAFVKNGIGDVLLTFENEARFANKVTHQSLTYVVPETNIKTEFPVTLIDQNVDKHGTRAVAEAFIKFLFSPEAQTIYAENGYRPSDPKVYEKFADEFGKVTTMLTIGELGGWDAINKKLFADGALYDQFQAARGR
ncbi:MAG: sulfate ABC transporter substrate-binding protein [Tepidisphaeraceae bacterium]